MCAAGTEAVTWGDVSVAVALLTARHDPALTTGELLAGRAAEPVLVAVVAIAGALLDSLAAGGEPLLAGLGLAAADQGRVKPRHRPR